MIFTNMEPRTHRLIGVVATILLAAASLSSRVGTEELSTSRSLLVLDPPQTVVRKQIDYPEQVRPWGQDATTSRTLSRTSESSDLAANDEATRTNLRSNSAPDGTESAKQPEQSMEREQNTAGNPHKSPEILSPQVSGTTFNLPKSAEEWCAPPDLPPLPYTNCQDTVTVNQLPLYGGLT